MVKTGRLLSLVILVFLLLLAQHQAFAHAIFHLSGSSSVNRENRQLPIDPVCEQCLVLAQAVSGLNSDPILFSGGTAAPEISSVGTAPIQFAQKVRCFQPRAPPTCLIS